MRREEPPSAHPTVGWGDGGGGLRAPATQGLRPGSWPRPFPAKGGADGRKASVRIRHLQEPQCRHMLKAGEALDVTEPQQILEP